MAVPAIISLVRSGIGHSFGPSPCHAELHTVREGMRNLTLQGMIAGTAIVGQERDTAIASEGSEKVVIEEPTGCHSSRANSAGRIQVQISPAVVNFVDVT